MWYLLRVDALIGAFVFGTAGLVIFAMFAWEEAKKLARAAFGPHKPATDTKFRTASGHAA
jgi:hypothetical protein